jgi:glycerophosphoryl diester phosphodiesterase
MVQKLRPKRPLTIDAFYAAGESPRIIAHRGWSGRYPENTLAAVNAALELGVEMVEIDVTVTADHEVVVIHDETLDRTTTGRGPVSGASFEQLRALDAGSWFAAAFVGERIPSLAEVLELCRGRSLLNVEIKPEAVSLDAPSLVADLVTTAGMVDSVVISSFDPEGLRQLASTRPELATASLLNPQTHRGMGPVDIVGQVASRALHVSDSQLTSEIVDPCRANRIPIAVYTINSLQRLREIRSDVAAIFTDHPDRMLETTESFPTT